MSIKGIPVDPKGNDCYNTWEHTNFPHHEVSGIQNCHEWNDMVYKQLDN